MKTHTNQLKTNISTLGRQLNSKITYELNGETIELGEESLNSVTPRYNADILKSIMRILEIDSNVDIPIGTILNYQFGVKVGNSYEYLNYGNYIVHTSERQEDLNSYKITCYDKMLYSMVDYEAMNITYPITIRDYISAICTHLGLTFKNANDQFANYNRVINNELYLDSEGKSLGYKFRDVLDELAQVTASTICINEEDDELEIRYITDTNDVITEDNFKDVKVDFGEKYGPINSIVLSRSAGADNIYERDEDSILQNGLCELKIEDNQIMNFNDRSDYLPDILEKLDGLEYYLNDFTSTGIMYYNVCDRYTSRINNKDYTCIMLNDEALVTDGLEENIHTDMPLTSVTDYSKSDKRDRKLGEISLIVNKQERQIEALVSDANELGEEVASTRATLNSQGVQINVLSTNIDENGEVTSVKTTDGFTFNNNGMNITKSGERYNTQHTYKGSYFKDGETIVGQVDVNGGKFKDMDLYGVYRYGKNSIDDEPMFIAQLYTNSNNEECFGHFWNGG